MAQEAHIENPLLDTILAMEHRVWLALITGDAAEDHALLSEDFLGVYPSGFADRADHAGQLDDGPSVAAYQLSQIQARAIGADHALLSYRAVYRRQGQSVEEAMYVSSLWQRNGDSWRNIFSQDTPAND